MIESVLNLVNSLGSLGPLIFIPIYMIGTIFFIPIGVLNLAAGVLFGVPLGFILVSIASVASEGILFLAGRHLTRGWILKKIESNKKVQELYDAVSDGEWKTVLLVRFSAILPFSVVNYALGLSQIRFSHYLAASWIGMIPGILLNLYLGSFVGKIIFEGHRQKTPAEWILFGVGLIATVGMTIYASLIVKKVLDAHDHPSKS